MPRRLRPGRHAAWALLVAALAEPLSRRSLLSGRLGLVGAWRPEITVCWLETPREVVPGGVARVRARDCLAARGGFCTVCVERCPVPGAIALVDGWPAVDPEVCTGCAVCASVCPAPVVAIAMEGRDG